jgi:hypothetical protein
MFSEWQIDSFRVRLEDFVSGDANALNALQQLLCQAREALVDIAIASGWSSPSEDAPLRTCRLPPANFIPSRKRPRCSIQSLCLPPEARLPPSPRRLGAKPDPGGDDEANRQESARRW